MNQSTEHKEDKSSRAILLGILKYAIYAFLFLGTLTGVYLYLNFSDVEPPDLSIFEVEEKSYPTDENSYRFFEIVKSIGFNFDSIISDRDNCGCTGYHLVELQLTQNFEFPKNPTCKQEGDCLELPKNERHQFSVNFVQSLIEKNIEVYAEFINAAENEIIQPPLQKMLNEDEDNLFLPYKLRTLLLNKIWLDLAKEDFQEAISTCMLEINFGLNILKADTTISLAGFGSSFISTGLKNLIYISDQPKISDQELTRVIQFLSSLTIPEDYFKNDISIEFQLVARELKDAVSGELFENSDLNKMGSLGFDKNETTYLLRNETLKMLRDRVVQIVDTLPEKNYSNLPKIPFHENTADLSLGPIKIPLIFRNTHGRELLKAGRYFKIFLPSTLHSLRLKKNLTKLRYALRQHWNQKGELPNQLSDLIPDYLSKIPKDNFSPTGEFKYNKIEKKIYSINFDGIDSGGEIFQESHLGKEPFNFEESEIPLQQIYIAYNFWEEKDAEPTLFLHFPPKSKLDRSTK